MSNSAYDAEDIRSCFLDIRRTSKRNSQTVTYVARINARERFFSLFLFFFLERDSRYATLTRRKLHYARLAQKAITSVRASALARCN